MSVLHKTWFELKVGKQRIGYSEKEHAEIALAYATAAFPKRFYAVTLDERSRHDR